MVRFRRNQKDFPWPDRSGFAPDRHLHPAFKDQGHDILRMAMAGNRGSRIEDHPSRPMFSQEQGLDPNPFLDLLGFFVSEGAKK